MEPVRIEWLLPDGRGVGRGPHGLVRVVGAIPGDRVRARETDRRGRSVNAELEALIEPSEHRRSPPCPWDDACGGCDLSAMRVEARRAALAHMVGHTLGIDAPEVIPSPRPTGHRARIKLAVDRGRLGYRASRSHELVEPHTCRIARPEVNAALASLREAELGDALDGVRSVEIRSDGERAVYAFEGAASSAPAALAQLGDVAWNGRALSGDPTLELEVHDHRLRASPRAFYQVNLEANRLLVAHVVAEVLAQRPERLLDLYAGNGNLTLPLASAAGVPVAAVEMEGASLQDLRHNAKRASLPIEVHARRVEKHDAGRTPFDVVVLDPPRAGAQGVLPRLFRQRPRAAIYVSCDIRSAQRDLKEARDAGYRIEAATCFDLFPDTHHVETVITLVRG